MYCTFYVVCKSSCLTHAHLRLFLMFSPSSFIVLGITFILTHLELVFIYIESYIVMGFFFACGYPLHLYQISVVHIDVGLFLDYLLCSVDLLFALISHGLRLLQLCRKSSDLRVLVLKLCSLKSCFSSFISFLFSSGF